MSLLKQNLSLHNSKILPLQLFIKNEFLHLGGRLKHSFFIRGVETPNILPKDHHVTKLIVEFIHKSNNQCSWYHLVSLTREKYWIVSCKSVCRELVNVCLYWKRQRVKLQQQLMFNLPEAWSVFFDPPFTHRGVD